METNEPSGLMALLTRRMSYLNQRQAVLAENVANADTPNYKAHDLTPFTFGDALTQAQVGMTVTNPRHIVPASMAGVNGRSVEVKTSEVLPSGNSVDLEQEMMKVSQTSVDYQTATSLYHKITGMFKIALKGSSN
jgi:flagellar basal-body rod protein FlgB